MRLFSLGRRMPSSTVWGNLNVYAFLPFPFLRQILSKLLISQNFSMILVAPLWPHLKEYFAELFLAGGCPTQTFSALELASSTSCTEVSQCLELPRLHTWKLSSGSSKRQAFLMILWRLPHQSSGDTRHVSTREIGPDSFVGVMERILHQARPHSCSKQNSSTVCGKS